MLLISEKISSAVFLSLACKLRKKENSQSSQLVGLLSEVEVMFFSLRRKVCIYSTRSTYCTTRKKWPCSGGLLRSLDWNTIFSSMQKCDEGAGGSNYHSKKQATTQVHRHLYTINTMSGARGKPCNLVLKVIVRLIRGGELTSLA